MQGGLVREFLDRCVEDFHDSLGGGAGEAIVLHADPDKLGQVRSGHGKRFIGERHGCVVGKDGRRERERQKGYRGVGWRLLRRCLVLCCVGSVFLVVGFGVVASPFALLRASFGQTGQGILFPRRIAANLSWFEVDA